MLKRIGQHWLRHFARRYAYDTTYMEELLDCSSTVFLKFSAVHLPSSHRRGIPLVPWSAARIRATMHEDCGPCTQLVCNIALEAGVDPATIAAVVTADLNTLDTETALTVQFTEMVLAHDPAANGLREQIRRRWGEAGLISLALTISATRVYPGVKYALGHGQACSHVQVHQSSVVPIHYPSTTQGAPASAARV